MVGRVIMSVIFPIAAFFSSIACVKAIEFDPIAAKFWLVLSGIFFALTLGVWFFWPNVPRIQAWRLES